MARQSPHRPDADEPDTEFDESSRTTDTATDSTADAAADPVEADQDLDDDEVTEPANRALWEDVRIDPVEIALPAGSGFTLRAYRMSNTVTPTEIGEREDDPFDARARRLEDEETVVFLDEEFAEDFEDDDGKPRRVRRTRDGDEVDDEELLADDDADDEEADEADDDEEAEEVAVFLTHRGKLLLFKSRESLVSFVLSGAPHDMSGLDTWDDLVARLQPADITPLDDDSYELDLVVENLRGGHDTWDPALLISAGEIARDLSYALRLPSVLDMLSTGSSLDDLDEALRATANGGLGGFMGRRRLKKIGAQTASLGWRTIIGKISASVDWRD
ncbi:DNA primase [Micromonospora sp. NBC_01699]|uniref:DNA primase n=1 Tax=Micromonospora sp. NBC_01699 TaxID=2975984 RepID=UPI002E2B3E19|nr:DNA primase [Micromonospora sp. NBC_01699]